MLLFPIIASFISTLVIILIFDSRIDYIIKRATFVTVFLVVANVLMLMDVVGLIGYIIIPLVALFFVKKVLGYDFGRAFLFILGQNILYNLVLFGLNRMFL